MVQSHFFVARWSAFRKQSGHAPTGSFPLMGSGPSSVSPENAQMLPSRYWTSPRLPTSSGCFMNSGLYCPVPEGPIEAPWTFVCRARNAHRSQAQQSFKRRPPVGRAVNLAASPILGTISTTRENPAGGQALPHGGRWNFFAFRIDPASIPDGWVLARLPALDRVKPCP